MPIPFITKSTSVSCKTGEAKNFFSKLVYKFAMRKAHSTVSKITPFIGKDKKLLEIGLGGGSVACELQRRGYKVSSVDIVNMSMYSDIQPILYDGERLPFKDQSFDCALLLHVLHHCSDQVQVLAEAKRVAKKVIVIEDVFRNPIERKILSASDMLDNFEFYPHPYRSVAQWKKTYRKHKLKLVHEQEWSECFPKTSLYSYHHLAVLKTVRTE